MRRSDFVLAALLCLIAAPAPAQTLDVVLTRLRDYLVAYERQLSEVVCEEIYVQEEYGPDNRGNQRVIRRRSLLSDVAFLRLPGNGYWYGTREAKRVDERPLVNKGLQIADLIAAKDVAAKHAAIMAVSSSYNLGEPRSINMPTVPLEVLQSGIAGLLTFKEDGNETVKGRKTRRIAFTEVGESTLIGHQGPMPVKIRGRAWVEPDTGRLWRVELDLRFPASRHPTATSFTMRVDFSLNTELAFLVPAAMNETFPGTTDRGKGVATYSNFRKFQTSARIIPPPGVETPSVDVLRDRLDKYLIDYEPQLSVLVADERMSQRVVGLKAVQPVERALNSEVAFIALPGNAGWLGFRHVITVNGRTTNTSARTLALTLADRNDEYAQAKRLLNDSAALNLGLPRTTNLPNLPLELLHPRHRQRFVHRLDGDEPVRGTPTTRVVFIERVSSSLPTMIQGPSGTPMESVVRAWIEPASGRLMRAEVTSRDVGSRAAFSHVIRVQFTENKPLGILVPSQMDEVFPVVGGVGTGQAMYTNYRRFQTSARVVPD